MPWAGASAGDGKLTALSIPGRALERQPRPQSLAQSMQQQQGSQMGPVRPTGAACQPRAQQQTDPPDVAGGRDYGDDVTVGCRARSTAARAASWKSCAGASARTSARQLELEYIERLLERFLA